MSYIRSRLVFALVILISACTPPTPDPANFVVVPASDSTPPTVGMTVNDNSTQNINVDGTSQAVTIHTSSDTVTVISGATDEDGGIKVVNLWATFTYYRPGQISGPGLAGAPIKQDVSTAQIGQSTLKNRFFSYNFDLKKEVVGWSSLKLDVWTDGENFFGAKVSTPVVSVTYP